VRLPLLIGALATLIVVVGGFYLLRRHAATQPEHLLALAREAISSEDFATAEQLANQVLERDEDTVPALLVAARAAASDGRYKDAVAYWDRIPDDCGKSGAAGLLEAGRVLLDKLDRATEAEHRFRRALHHDPDLVAAIHQLANLLAVEGRTSEAEPLILDLLAHGQVNIDQLSLLGMPQGTINDADLLRRCHVADREDPAILLGLAASVTFNLSPEQAQLLLSEAIRLDPSLVDAQTRLGKLLLGNGDAAEFLAWHEQLPENANSHPEIWALRGDWAENRGEKDIAIRCYWEAVRRDPNHRAALYQLGQLLLREGQSGVVGPLIERAEQLQTLRQLEDVLFQTEQTGLEPMRKVAEQMVTLGRLWEAWGWCDIALEMQANESWALEMRRELSETLETKPPRTLAAANPVAGLDLSSYPLPSWTSEGIVARASHEQVPSFVAFVENASDAKMDFQYFNNSHPAAEGKRMYEFPGGGAAILDFDLDGWPDTYLSQGCPWPLDPTQRTHLDQFFRNVDGQHFEEVSGRANLIEPQFSHGVTVGDFDNDGFPDVYVANIGHNRLFHNNGDGTFDDVSLSVAGDAERWTTSCLLADVNGDGFPDLYDVNYVDAPDVFERICKHADGVLRMCMPFHFPGAQDQLYLNQGDGRFSDVTSTAGIEAGDGKGLGIVAGDFDDTGRLSLFIANDTTPNFFFANQTPKAGKSTDSPAKDSQSRTTTELLTAPLFAENAVLRGLAFNANGRSEGCMGIAAGDIDRDGLIDLFVGNFLKETNTLYRQSAGGIFSDETRGFSLEQPSVELLSFGTQFVDAELDGDLDLIVTNGHVDDVRAYGRPYHMRPQFYENLGDGRMTERRGATLGEFFEGEYLGRSLAKFDWNRDGLEDVVISHLDSPAALLTNRSQPAGHVLVLRLVGVTSNRDAIGATATLRFGSKTQVRQLTAGDGYQCSNQRTLVFGLGSESSLDELQIKWPSGKTSSFTDLAVDCEMTIVESHTGPPTCRNLNRRVP